MSVEQLQAEIERLNGVLVKLHLHKETLTNAFLSSSEAARHNYEEAELRMSLACAWAFDLARAGVSCYWCHRNLGNDSDAVRQHTAACEKRPSPERDALAAILSFEPKEVVKDAFAYDRLLLSVKEAARKGLGLDVTLAG
jgi:hypothetical protein